MYRIAVAAVVAAGLLAGCGGDKEAECKAAWEQQVKTTSIAEAAAGNQAVIEACQGLPPETISRISSEAKAASTSRIWNPNAG